MLRSSERSLPRGAGSGFIDPLAPRYRLALLLLLFLFYSCLVLHSCMYKVKGVQMYDCGGPDVRSRGSRCTIPGVQMYDRPQDLHRKSAGFSAEASTTPERMERVCGLGGWTIGRPEADQRRPGGVPAGSRQGWMASPR